MYLSYRDFNINKERLQIENRENLIFLTLVTSHCQACIDTKLILRDLPDTFNSVKFAVINVDKNPQFIEMLKLVKINVQHAPTFLLFKLGVFDRILDIETLTKENFRKSLLHELDVTNISPKTSNAGGYLKFYDM